MSHRKGRPRRMAVNDKVTYVSELVAFLYERMQSGLAAIAFARAGDGALAKRSDSFETKMLRLSVQAALEFSAIRVARALDPPEYGNASLPEVFELLNDNAVRSGVLDGYSPLPRSLRDREMKSAVERWARVSADPRRGRLRKLRSHTLAHNLIFETLRDGSTDMLLLSDLVLYAEDVFGVVDQLAVACLGTTSQLAEVRTEAQQAADRIWQRLCGL